MPVSLLFPHRGIFVLSVLRVQNALFKGSHVADSLTSHRSLPLCHPSRDVTGYPT